MDALPRQVLQALLQVGCIMLRIDGVRQWHCRQVLVGRTMSAAVERIIPGRIRMVAALAHCCHDQQMKLKELVWGVVKDIVNSGVPSTPAQSPQRGDLPMLAQQLLSGEQSNQILMPQSHDAPSFSLVACITVKQTGRRRGFGNSLLELLTGR